jgi:hypothetical protein
LFGFSLLRAAATSKAKAIQGGTYMERRTRKTHRRREVEKLLNEIAFRSMIIMLLGFFAVLCATRPSWAVKTVRLLLDAAKGVGTYL